MGISSKKVQSACQNIAIAQAAKQNPEPPPSTQKPPQPMLEKLKNLGKQLDQWCKKANSKKRLKQHLQQASTKKNTTISTLQSTNKELLDTIASTSSQSAKAKELAKVAALEADRKLKHIQAELSKEHAHVNAICLDQISCQTTELGNL